MSGKKPSARQRRQRDPEVLKTAAEHVCYEIEMLRYAASYIPPNASSPADLYSLNIGLEAFLLHYRNLRAFFCPTLQRTDDNDVIASDYLDKPTAEDVAEAEGLGFDKERLDRSLAHLSYDRVTYGTGDKSWPVADMLASVERALLKFRNQLARERRGWFPEPRASAPSWGATSTTLASSFR